MHRIPAFTRRSFLKGAAGALGAALAWALRWRGARPSQAQPSELTPRAYVPYIAASAARPRVVHVHHSGATDWDFQNDWYGEHVDQRSVDAMMDEGLKQLTGASSVGAAWGRLLPDYVPGQKIAIKVNFVNAGCEDGDNLIDALIEPVNALVGSLVAASVREQDITVYDASRPMPARFYGRRLYPGVRYCDSDGCADERATFRLENQSLRVAFSYPGAQIQRWLTDVLRRAAYVVNVPILKRHALHPVSLGFKNHFGSLNDLGGPEDDNPHTYITPSDSRYSADYSPLVDTYANPNIAGKTVLTVGDGLFGAPSVHAAPIPWHTFGERAPNSLLFSRDPVAIDCVMCDLLRAEWEVADAAYDYLRLAEMRGMGVFEQGEPWGGGYARIEYVYVAMA